jgi:hypothetical protein
MPLTQIDYVVQALAADRSDQPFSEAVLPGRGWCNRLVADTHGAQSASSDSAIDLISIAHEEWRNLVGDLILRMSAENTLWGAPGIHVHARPQGGIELMELVPKRPHT